MSEKMSTLILKVDLECTLCNKKIRKVLDQYQDRWDIQKVTYDEKNNKITLVGPFDGDKLSKRLCSKACRTIKEIIIPEPPKPDLPNPPVEKPKPAPEPVKPPKPDPPKPPVEKPKPAPEPVKPPKPDPPKPPVEKPKPAPEPVKPQPDPPKPPVEKPKPAPEPPKPKPSPQPGVWFTGHFNGYGPCPEGFQVQPQPQPQPCNCGCGNAGGYGYGNYNSGYSNYGYSGPPPPPGYGRPVCQVYCEDDQSSCTII